MAPIPQSVRDFLQSREEQLDGSETVSHRQSSEFEVAQ
jgi:hypothetical protein